MLAAAVRSAPVESACAAPRPEAPRLLQRESLAVAPGHAVVLYLSSAARRRSFVLQPTEGRAGPSVPLVMEPITPNVFRARIPSQVQSGSYEVASRTGPGRATLVGRITVGTGGAAVAPGPVAGRFLASDEGRVLNPIVASVDSRRGSELRFALASRALQDVVVVFRWRLGGSERSNAVWVTGERALQVAMVGRCANFPHDAGGVPPAGTRVEVAQVGADGAPGPWTAYTTPAR
jgi:hypothetical protein